MKRILALILVLLMIAPLLLSCAKELVDETVESTESQAIVSDPLPEANPEWKDKQFTVIFRENYDYEWVYVEEDAGSLINDAIYQRNSSVENRYGITLNYAPAPTASFENDFLAPITNSIMAGDDSYQLVAGYTYRLAPNSTYGNFLDWYSIPNINLEGEWWEGDFAKAASYNKHTFIMTGSLSLSHLYSAACVFFNQDIVNNNFTNEGGSAAVYELVKEGKWTYEAFLNYVSKCTVNDGEMTEEDTYGYASNDTTAVDGFLFSFDIPLTTRNSKGNIVLTKQNDNEKIINTAKKINELFNTSGYTFNQSTSTAEIDTHIGMMKLGRAAFTTSYLESATDLRTTDLNYGILPYPKWDEEQENYHGHNMDFASSFAIPKTVSDVEFVGAVTEALAYYSYQYVREALYGTVLKYRDAKDLDSSMSIDIILDNIKYDFSYIYAFAWGDQQGPTALLRNCIRAGHAYIANNYEMSEKRFKSVLNDFLKAFN